MSAPILRAAGLCVKKGEQTIFDDVSLSVTDRTAVLIQGTSGSGKTTLFEMLGLLDVPTAGELFIAGEDVTEASEGERSKLRRETIGIVYQDFQLVPDLTARENAALPQSHTGNPDTEWLDTVFERLEITDLEDRYPATLSGGEKQRVAIARAVANKPDILLADEPTGQLDPDTTDQVLSLLFDAQDLAETTLLTVSHDLQIESRFEEVYRLQDGTLRRKEAKATASQT